MNDREKLVQLIDAIPDDKLGFVITVLEALIYSWKLEKKNGIAAIDPDS